MYFNMYFNSFTCLDSNMKHKGRNGETKGRKKWSFNFSPSLFYLKGKCKYVIIKDGGKEFG